MDKKQIDAKMLLLNFNASGSTEATINVPFLVTDILFRPPVSLLVPQPNPVMSYIIVSTICSGGIQTMSSTNSVAFANDFRHRFANPTAIRGSYTFSFFSIFDGSPVAFTGGVAFPIEFIGYN